MDFSQTKEYEIMSSSQLESPQSEVYSPRYRILKIARSAEFTNSDSSNVSSIASGACTG
jgi:hypothetical protein